VRRVNACSAEQPFQGEFYAWGPYLSPFYSPEIFGSSSHALFGPRPEWWPALLPFSPAFLILWAPAGFRITCYYYRGASYKAFWHDPPSCSVGEPRSSYWGENSFPLIVQNLHRYFLIFALALLVPILRDTLARRRGAPTARHFDRAYRRLRRRAKGPPSPRIPAEALIEVHAAFNATAGRAVFEHDLARFFVEHPRFEPLRASIEAFFAESGRVLYGRDRGAPDTHPDLDRLRELCRACRDAERRR